MMGYYIDPLDGSAKEAWLAQHGSRISDGDAQSVFLSGSHLPVCLIDNGFFTAAAIGYSVREIEALSDAADPRPKTWFQVPRPDLKPFYPNA